MAEDEYYEEDPEGPMARGGYEGSRFGITRFSQSSKQRFRKAIDIVLLIVFLGLIGMAVIYGIAYLNTSGAERGIAGLTDPFDKLTNFFKYQVFQRPQEVGSVWTANSNSSAEQTGIIFKGFKSVGSKVVPYGALTAFRYDLDVSPGAEELEIELFCNPIGKGVGDFIDGDIKTLPDRPMVSYEDSMSYSNFRCQFKTMQPLTADEEETIRVQGNIAFPFSTNRAKRKVYFISSDGYSALDKDRFFKQIKKELPLKTTYNKEPVEVGIGISADDDYKEPVVVGEEAGYLPLIGISLINRWDGIVRSVDDMAIYLPDGVSINEEYSPKSMICPFSNAQMSGGSQFNRYTADKELLKQIGPFGKGKLDMAKELETGIVEEFKYQAPKSNYNNFECWLSIDSSVATNDPKPDAYLVDVSYTYQYSARTESITLRPTGVAAEENSEETTEETTEENEEEEEDEEEQIKYYLCRYDAPFPRCACSTSNCINDGVLAGQGIYDTQSLCDAAKGNSGICPQPQQ